MINMENVEVVKALDRNKGGRNTAQEKNTTRPMS
jgi:hypothetical protein